MGEGDKGEKEEEREGGRERERELRAVFVLGTIVAGWEVGFELPAVRILHALIPLILFLRFFFCLFPCFGFLYIKPWASIDP